MQCQLIRELIYGPSAGPELDGTPAAVGTIIDNPAAYVLVANGDALPADDECAERCYRKLFPKQPSAGQLTKVQREQLQERIDLLIRRKHPVAAGIHPDDYHAFETGEMTGYDPETGDPIPGENAQYDGPLELPN